MFRFLLLFCSHSESRVTISSPSCQLTEDTSCYYELQMAQEQLLQQTVQLTQSAQKGTCRQFLSLQNKCWNLTYLQVQLSVWSCDSSWLVLWWGYARHPVKYILFLLQQTRSDTYKCWNARCRQRLQQVFIYQPVCGEIWSVWWHHNLPTYSYKPPQVCCWDQNEDQVQRCMTESSCNNVVMTTAHSAGQIPSLHVCSWIWICL